MGCNAVSQKIPVRRVYQAAAVGAFVFGAMSAVLQGGRFWWSWWILLGPVLLFPLILLHELAHFTASLTNKQAQNRIDILGTNIGAGK